uniref:Uncharacterized protein n=2 Tax=Pseudomonas fluorescens TaxID=294 RepID=A0A0G4E5M3_PSEFS|nr:hypothetical protein PQBR57_0370 [Pseudomonas fluorescens SBW25]
MDQPINWLVLLGQIEDSLLASLITDHYSIRVTPFLIEAIRSDLGISSFSARKPKLTLEIRDLVGRHTANNIARGWGVSVSAIEAFRNLAKQGLAQVDDAGGADCGRWKNEWLELFPIQTNAQISRATGFEIKEVRAMRNTLKIAAPMTRTYWKLVSEDELGSLSDVQLSELYGGPLADYAAQRLSMALRDKATIRAIAKNHQLPETLAQFLGLMPLRRLAKLAGISEFHIKRQRDALGIAPYSPLAPEFEAMLATCTDSEIAQKAHASVSTVKFRRDRLGKPAYAPKNKAQK